MSLKYCAVEGSMFSGKTSTVEYLQHLGIPAIEEPRVDIRFPQLMAALRGMPDQYDKYVQLIDAYLSIESERTAKIEALSSSSSLVVADRSVLSPIVFEAVAGRTGRGRPEDRMRSRDYAIRRIASAIQAGQIVMQNSLIVMRVDSPQLFAERVAARNAQNTWVADHGVATFWADTIYANGRAILGDAAAQYVAPETQLTRNESIAAAGQEVLRVIQSLPANAQPEPINILLTQPSS